MELAVEGSSFLWKDDIGGICDGDDDNDDDDKGQDCGGAGQQNTNIFW